MVSSCDAFCFKRCAVEMDLSSGDPSIHGNLYSMARCFTDVCHLDYSDKNSSKLADVYQMLASLVNLTVNYTNCPRHIKPKCLAHDYDPSYAVPLMGYLSPFIVFLTVINNAFVCTILMKPDMRNPTNAILVSMALCDTLTGLFPVFIFLHFYATDRFYEWVPYNWCYAIDIFSQYLPSVFHTVSIWLTMGLAIQRYIGVCHPVKAKRWCTIRKVVYGTIVINVVSVLFHTTPLFVFSYVDTEIPSQLHPNQYASACILRESSVPEWKLDLYLNIFMPFRLVFINLIPDMSLVVMNSFLIYTMRTASVRRKQLLAQNKIGESRKLIESNYTTLMLVTVVGIFLLVEIPIMFFNILLIVNRLGGILFIKPDTWHLVIMFLNFFILLSFPFNFYIYCCMSNRFREAFKQIFMRSIPSI